MIYHTFTQAELEAKVDQAAPGWRAEAAAKTQAALAAGAFLEKEKDHSWSKVKGVFLELQRNKCIFCERRLPAGKYGAVEADLEHFRPKKKVLVWPSKKAATHYSFPTGGKSESGYFWLAYDLSNYAVACKTCNTGLKRNHFPIAGARATQPAADLAALNAAEKPLLLFPLGPEGDDPTPCMVFEGVVPQVHPKPADPYASWRAKVTIDFFALADPNREELFRERFMLIDLLWLHLERRENSKNPADRQAAAERVQDLLASHQPHAACARHFYELCQRDPALAHEIWKLAKQYGKSSF